MPKPGAEYKIPGPIANLISIALYLHNGIALIKLLKNQHQTNKKLYNEKKPVTRIIAVALFMPIGRI